MIIDKYATITITYHNKRHFEELGYQCKDKQRITVSINNLPYNSSCKVNLLCDYCLENKIETLLQRSYKDAYLDISQDKKHACRACSLKYKMKDTFINKYGVENPFQADVVKEKIKKTNLERYGVEYPSQSHEIYAKITRSFIEQYGVERPLQSQKILHQMENNIFNKYGISNVFKIPEVKRKIASTNLKKYGFEICAKSNIIKIKSAESCMKKYGYKSSAQSPLVKAKIAATNLKKYGVSCVFKNKDIKDKIENTIYQKYGVRKIGESKLIKEKIIKTNLERYGVPCILSLPEIHTKIKATNMKKYGVEHLMQLDSYKQMIIKKGLQTKFSNNNTGASKQQQYVCNLLNGVLNYPVDHCQLDIAFPNEKLYVEYDGGGHDLNLKFGQITKEEFEQREFKRNHYLTNRDWKQIRIISSKDLLPEDHKILELIYECRKYLNQGHSWIHINLDNTEIKCSQYIRNIELGPLRKIKGEILL